MVDLPLDGLMEVEIVEQEVLDEGEECQQAHHDRRELVEQEQRLQRKDILYLSQGPLYTLIGFQYKIPPFLKCLLTKSIFSALYNCINFDIIEK